MRGFDRDVALTKALEQCRDAAARIYSEVQDTLNQVGTGVFQPEPKCALPTRAPAWRTEDRIQEADRHVHGAEFGQGNQKNDGAGRTPAWQFRNWTKQRGIFVEEASSSYATRAPE